MGKEYFDKLYHQILCRREYLDEKTIRYNIIRCINRSSRIFFYKIVELNQISEEVPVAKNRTLSQQKETFSHYSLMCKFGLLSLKRRILQDPLSKRRFNRGTLIITVIVLIGCTHSICCTLVLIVIRKTKLKSNTV